MNSVKSDKTNPQSAAGKIRTRIWVLCLFLILGLLAVGIWKNVCLYKASTENNDTTRKINDSSIRPTPAITITPINIQTSNPPSLETNKLSTTVSNAQQGEVEGLRNRIKELEGQTEAMRVKSSNLESNARSPIVTGTWVGKYIGYGHHDSSDNTNILTRIVISSTASSTAAASGQGNRIHLWESYSLGKTLDWGESPVYYFGTDANTAQLGFAEFTGMKGESEFKESFKVYLLLKFESNGLWINRSIKTLTNSQGRFIEEFLVPANQ